MGFVNRDEIKKKMEEKFSCPKCDSKGGKTHEIAMTGTGLSKIIDVQYNEFLIVYCTKCGYTEFYNLDVISGGNFTMNLLDVLFG